MAPRKPQTVDPRQFSLEGYFEIPAAPRDLPGTLNIEHELRAWLNQAIKDSRLGRDQIGAKMTELLGGDDEDFHVSKAMLDAWTGQSRTSWRFPLSYLPAFIAATGAYWLLDRIAQKCGCRTLVGEEALFAEYGRLDALEEDLKRRKAELKKKLPQRHGAKP